jgi:hypothetical protein
MSWNRGFYCGVIGTAIGSPEGEATVTHSGWRRWQLLVVTALAFATACTSPRARAQSEPDGEPGSRVAVGDLPGHPVRASGPGPGNGQEGDQGRK